MAETAENRVLAVGVHGIGDHARRTVLPAMDACTAVRLAAVSTRNRETREETAAQWNCPGWSSLDDMLESTELDAVMVCSPIGRHHDDGAKVLTAGVHLWCEKAFTRTLAEAKDLCAIASERDLGVCVSLAPAYHALFETIRELLNDGAIGRVRDIVGHFGFPHLERGRTVYDPDLGGGALLDVGYYPLVLAALLTGESPRTLGARVAADPGYEVDTEGAALLEFPSGVQAAAQWGYGRDYINELSIVGDSGAILATPAFSKPAHLPLSLKIRRQNEIEDVPVAACNQFAEMLGRFATAMDDADSRRTFRDEALAHQAILSDVAQCAARQDTEQP